MVSALALALGLAAAAHAAAPTTGSHFNLNLHGHDKCPGDDLKGGNRHSILVLLHYSDPDPDPVLGDDTPLLASLDRRNKIFLAPGSDFQVTDGNACDGDGAAITLPANIATAWEVWVKELGKLGKPGKPDQPAEGDIRTCAVSDQGTPTDASDDELVCSTENVILFRETGKPRYRNVTTELTTLLIDTDGDGVDDRVNLFDPLFYLLLLGLRQQRTAPGAAPLLSPEQLRDAARSGAGERRSLAGPASVCWVTP